MADTLKASEIGLTIVDDARRRKHWTKTETVQWRTDANVSHATLKRFWRGCFIDRVAFVSICNAVGVDWQDIVEQEVAQPASAFLPEATATDNSESSVQTGLFIPNQRCRIVWGRDSLATEILDRLQDANNLPIICLWGGPGYGKTELAAQVARQSINNGGFSDVLWVTARSNELVEGKIVSKNLNNNTESYTSRVFWGEIANQLGCSLSNVKETLKRKRFLIVLDNAETSDLQEILAQLIDTLNPSRALLTSRIKTKPQYVKILEIQGLDKSWTFQFLRDEAKHNDITSLAEATEVELLQLHELSCGAPLALHFIVGRVFHDGTLEHVISELVEAGKRVEIFYKFCLETAWNRIGDDPKNVLRYSGHVADAGVLQVDLEQKLNLSSSQLNEALGYLKQWYLIEDKIDNHGIERIDLHPWVRNSVRGGLVDTWKPSKEYLQEVAKLKRMQIKWSRDLGNPGL
jgi:hypothetical protein